MFLIKLNLCCILWEVEPFPAWDGPIPYSKYFRMLISHDVSAKQNIWKKTKIYIHNLYILYYIIIFYYSGLFAIIKRTNIFKNTQASCIRKSSQWLNTCFNTAGNWGKVLQFRRNGFVVPGSHTTFSCNFFINSDCPEIDSLDFDLRMIGNPSSYTIQKQQLQIFLILQGKDLQLWSVVSLLFGCTHVAWVWTPEKWQILRRKPNHGKHWQFISAVKQWYFFYRLLVWGVRVLLVTRGSLGLLYH